MLATSYFSTVDGSKCGLKIQKLEIEILASTSEISHLNFHFLMISDSNLSKTPPTLKSQSFRFPQKFNSLFPSGEALQHASLARRQDRTVVLAAVHRAGRALQAAAPHLRDEKDR